MTVKDEKGRILTSKNPVIIGMWQKAKYEEIKENKRPVATNRKLKKE